MRDVSGGEFRVITITLQIDAPKKNLKGVKEDLAMYMEKWGDVRLLSAHAEDKTMPLQGQTGLFTESEVE